MTADPLISLSDALEGKNVRIRTIGNNGADEEFRILKVHRGFLELVSENRDFIIPISSIDRLQIL